MRLNRMLRIRLSVKSTAPSSWLVATHEPARLHRRLRRVGAVARAAAARGDATVAAMATELEDNALAVEAHLVLLSRLWRRERDARHEVIGQVVQLEHLAARLASSAAEAYRRPALMPGSQDALADLTERLDALDAARRELRAVEQF
jgi:hypothetical protein